MALTVNPVLALLPADPEPDPGTEGWEKPPPAGPDAPGGGGAESRWRTGTGGAVRKRFHADVPLQEAVLHFLVAEQPHGEEDGGLEVLNMTWKLVVRDLRSGVRFQHREIIFCWEGWRAGIFCGFVLG